MSSSRSRNVAAWQRPLSTWGFPTSTVSEVIADLEGGVGVKLLDRGPHGVQPTTYGDALLKRSIAAFDELKQGIKDIEFLADPTRGELKIACGTAIATTIIPFVLERFAEKYPRVVVHFDDVASATRNLPELRDRKYDLILRRGRLAQAEEHLADDLSIELLFDDPLVVAAGLQSRWARRRKIDLAELLNEPWIMQAPHTWNYQRLAEAFHARGLDMPKASLVTLVYPGHCPFPCQWSAHHRMSEVGGALLLAESAACRFADSNMARRNRDPETSYVKPGG